MTTVIFFSSHIYANENPQVAVKTELGWFTIELYPNEAPITVANFLAYVDSRFYEGTIFHRVIPGVLAQGGGITANYVEKITNKAIKNESFNGLKNEYRTVAMARMQNPDSATAQFYINLKTNKGFDLTAKNPGYAVFGKVISGIEIIENIAAEPRGKIRTFPDAPNYPVRILSVERVNKDSHGNISSTPAPLQNSRIKDALVPQP